MSSSAEALDWSNTAPDSGQLPAETTEHTLRAVPEPETTYGPELPSFSYVSGRTKVGDREIPIYTTMDPLDALRVTQVQDRYPGTRLLFPAQLLQVIRGEESVILHNMTLAGVAQLGSRVTIYQATLRLE